MKKWETLESETVFHAAPFVKVVKERVKVRPGVVVDDFYKVHLRPFVCCVPFLENGKVVMLRQYKHGLGDVSLTFPGGFIEDDEPAEIACKRELLEETGLHSAERIRLGSFVDNGNQRGCKGEFFVATGCKPLQTPNSGDLEEMEILELDPREIDRAIQEGNIAITHHAFAWLLACHHW